MADPLFILTRAAASVNTALDLALFINKVKTCPDDVRACFSLVKRVNDDVEYAVSLRTKNRLVLAQRPYEAQRIDSIIESALESLLDIGILVERCRPAAHRGSVPTAERFKWVLKDSNSFILRSRNLQAQHLAISGEIAHLRSLVMAEPAPTAMGTTTFENLDLLQAKTGFTDALEGYRKQSAGSTSSLPLHRVSSGETLVGSISEDTVSMQQSPRRDSSTLQMSPQYPSPWSTPSLTNEYARDRLPSQVTNPIRPSYLVDNWETAERRSIIEERTMWEDGKPRYEAPSSVSSSSPRYEVTSTFTSSGPIYEAPSNFSPSGPIYEAPSNFTPTVPRYEAPSSFHLSGPRYEAPSNFSPSGRQDPLYEMEVPIPHNWNARANSYTPVSDTAEAYFRDLALQAEERRQRLEQRRYMPR